MKTTIEIQNLKCGGCEKTIRKQLGNLPFVNNLNINVEESIVRFDVIPEKDIAFVLKILSELGYPVVGDKNSLGKKAKSYVSCAIGRIQK